MSTLTTPEAPSTPPASSGPSFGLTRARFDSLRGRVRRGIWVESLGVLSLLLIAYAVPTFLTDRFLRLEWVFRFVLLASFLFVVLRMLRNRLIKPLAVTLNDDEMALAVERRAPGMRQALISSLQFDRSLAASSTNSESINSESTNRESTNRESRDMMAAVVADTTERLDSIPFHNAIDSSRIRKFFLGIAACIVFFVGWAVIDTNSLGIWAQRNVFLASVDWPRYTTLGFADTADGVRIPQGDALTVRVAATGTIPEQVFLSYEFASGETGTEPMSSTGDEEFTLTLDAVLEDVVLRAEGGDALPVELRVTVVERPRIDEMALTITYPAYMEREPELVPATEGDLRMPRGSKLGITGRSHKPLVEAFALFGNDQKFPLQNGGDGHSFEGELSPTSSGLLVIDVIDTDQLGAGTPPKLLLRVGDDKPPTVDFRLRGIGSLISTHARIPGDLKVKDDFGLREIDASMRVTVDQIADTKPDPESPLPQVPFENAEATYGDPMEKNALRYETAAMIDLRQWNKDPNQNAKSNRIRPGMLLSLRFGATDNFGPGDPHHGYGETMTFRVVTRERLLEDLRRRQVEQRQELQKIVEEHQAAMLELRETVNPAEAGERERRARARLKTLARQQVALGRRTAFISESYQRILWEYENNRLIEPGKVRQMEGAIPAPLRSVAKDAFPVTGRLVDDFSSTAKEDVRIQALGGYEDIERRLLAVLREMEQAETLAALLEELRVVIKIEDSVIQEVEDKARASEESVLGPGKDSPKKPKKTVPKETPQKDGKPTKGR